MLLGASLWSVLEQLRSYQHSFPQVDVKFDPDYPATTPTILHVRPHLDLLFSGHQQRLHTISIRRLRDDLHPPLTLYYKDAPLTSVNETLRRVTVNRTFGPTYAGEELRYPGVRFAFDEDGTSKGRGVESTRKAGKEDDRNQEVKKIIVCEKDFDGDERDALDEVRECPTMFGDVSSAVVKVSNICIYGRRLAYRLVRYTMASYSTSTLHHLSQSMFA